MKSRILYIYWTSFMDGPRGGKHVHNKFGRLLFSWPNSLSAIPSMLCRCSPKAAGKNGTAGRCAQILFWQCCHLVVWLRIKRPRKHLLYRVFESFVDNAARELQPALACPTAQSLFHSKTWYAASAVTKVNDLQFWSSWGRTTITTKWPGNPGLERHVSFPSKTERARA